MCGLHQKLIVQLWTFMRRTAQFVAFVSIVAALYAFWQQREDVAAVRRLCPDFTSTCVSSVLAQDTDASLEQVALRLRRLYDREPLFRPHCRRTASQTGIKIAERGEAFSQEHNPLETVCNYGLIEGFSRSRAQGGDTAGAAAFCSSVRDSIAEIVPDAAFECFRGIGRGLPFADTSLYGDAIAMLERARSGCSQHATTRDEYIACVSGAFNFVGIEVGRSRYGLSAIRDYPLALCSQFPEDEQGPCEGNFKWAAVSLVGEEDPLSRMPSIVEGAESVQALPNLSSTARIYLMRALSYEAGRLAVARDSDSDGLESCSILDASMKESCAIGYALGLAKLGVPRNQHTRVTRFCSDMVATGVSYSACISNAMQYLFGFYDTRARDALCRQLQHEGIECDQYQRVP